MKFEHYLKRVEESPEFKQFQEEHKKAFLTAGFFVLDFESGKHMHQLDYFIPGSKKIATFVLDEGVKMNISEMKFKGKVPGKLDEKAKIDLDALQGIVHDEMLNRTVTQQVKKIIAVLMNEDGKKVWKLNCITGDLGIIKVNVDDSSSGILEFEKASLFDMMKIIPKPGQQSMSQQEGQAPAMQMPVEIKTQPTVPPQKKEEKPAKKEEVKVTEKKEEKTIKESSKKTKVSEKGKK